MQEHERSLLNVFIVYAIILLGIIVFSFITQAAATAQAAYPLMHTTRELFIAFALLSFAWTGFIRRKVYFQSQFMKYQIYIWTGVALAAIMCSVVLIHRIETQTYVTQNIHKKAAK